MVVALATIGVAYGAWTDQLNINGTVHTGTLDVQLQVAGFDPTEAGGCTYVFSDANDTLTITASNATPGMVCWSQIEVKNIGTVPIKIQSVDVIETGEEYWAIDCNFEGMTLLPNGDFGGECLVWADIPDDNSSQNKTAGITIAVNAVQAP
jgi:predicted ribosomally synthesized peptide with SipW-like signal peptide